ncbi:AEC family transporter [Spiroplasma turonicum]|uniref:Malate permease n=1 Tax=Spiroplasma turonicum TaxID=216946 RepID=A0A0K1P6P9_9MOLU|nr:AEC family transporter [Spiroplasma turonicum]AKU79889.1 malate permease [Spiroplasma turonicum]ALX70900.1 malate permease [Spiroplasma turonicum]
MLTSVTDALVNTLSSWNIWSAIIATISVILLGYLLAYKKIFKQEWEKVMIKIVMVVGLPALALKGFLTNASIESLKEQLSVLLIGFAFYTIMLFISKYFFLKKEKDIQDTLAMCIALASTTFFGIPIVTSIYNDEFTNMTANIFNIPYRIFLYSLAFIIMSKKNMTISVKKKKSDMTEVELIESKKVKKQTLKNIFVNPILIATFLGFVIWVTQLIPGINAVSYDGKDYFSPLRVDKLFPPMNKILTTLQAICTPLAWLAIGMTMNKGNLKLAMKDKLLWYASFIKVIIAPTIILILIISVASLGHYTNSFSFNSKSLAAMVIMTAAPPANVVVAYAISYNKSPEMASNLTTLSTLLSIITLPIWVVISTVVGALPMFVQ